MALPKHCTALDDRAIAPFLATAKSGIPEDAQCVAFRRSASQHRNDRGTVVQLHSITSSARASNVAGTSMPSALAVLRLIRSTPPLPHARRMRNLRNLLDPHATKPTETTRSARPLPARARADRHARDSKPPSLAGRNPIAQTEDGA